MFSVVLIFIIESEVRHAHSRELLYDVFGTPHRSVGRLNNVVTYNM
jgi:hypothetical protein